MLSILVFLLKPADSTTQSSNSSLIGDAIFRRRRVGEFRLRIETDAADFVVDIFHRNGFIAFHSWEVCQKME